MIWAIFILFGAAMLGGLIYFSRKQAVDAKGKADLQSTVTRAVKNESESAKIDIDVAARRGRLRDWLRGKDNRS